MFTLDIRRARLIRLRQQMTEKISVKEDSFLICDLGPSNKTGPPTIQFTGRRRPLTSDGRMIV